VMCCGKDASSTSSLVAAVAAGSQVFHEVLIDATDDTPETFTGRRFTSILQAQSYQRQLSASTSIRPSR
jgi:hypothetical protein